MRCKARAIGRGTAAALASGRAWPGAGVRIRPIGYIDEAPNKARFVLGGSDD